LSIRIRRTLPTNRELVWPGAGKSPSWIKVKNPKHPAMAGEGSVSMTTITKLLAQKEQLLARLREDPGPEERERIEELLAKINTA
jgi:DNA-binding protein H-NS